MTNSCYIFQYVSIAQSIKAVLSCNAAADCLLWPDVSEKATFTHSFDGRHPARLAAQLPEDCVALLIELYYDDFEVANPLGSKKTLYKIGAFYFTIKNLPNRFNSNTANVHLVALGHTSELMVRYSKYSII